MVLARSMGRADTREPRGPAPVLDADIAQLASRIDGLAEKMSAVMAESRDRLSRSGVEFAWVTSDTKLAPVLCTQGIFRVVCYLVSTPNAGTLQLKGDAGHPTFRISVPAGTSSQMIGGDSYGGIFLDQTDVRLLTNGGAAGEMAILLMGERMGDQFKL